MADQLSFAVIVEKGERNFSAYAPELQGMAEDQRPLPTSSIIATQLLSFDVPEHSIQ